MPMNCSPILVLVPHQMVPPIKEECGCVAALHRSSTSVVEVCYCIYFPSDVINARFARRH